MYEVMLAEVAKSHYVLWQMTIDRFPYTLIFYGMRA